MTRELFFEIAMIIFLMFIIQTVCSLAQVRFSTTATAIIATAAVYLLIVFTRDDMREKDLHIR